MPGHALHGPGERLYALGAAGVCGFVCRCAVFQAGGRKCVDEGMVVVMFAGGLGTVWVSVDGGVRVVTCISRTFASACSRFLCGRAFLEGLDFKDFVDTDARCS